MTVLLSLLARVPLWLWLVLLFVGIAGAHEYRLRAKVAALQEQVDDRAAQAIEDARALVRIDLEGLATATESTKAAALAAGMKADAAAAKSRALDAALARTEIERVRLAAPLRRGDCARLAEITARALKAGYDFRPDPC